MSHRRPDTGTRLPQEDKLYPCGQSGVHAVERAGYIVDTRSTTWRRAVQYVFTNTARTCPSVSVPVWRRANDRQRERERHEEQQHMARGGLKWTEDTWKEIREERAKGWEGLCASNSTKLLRLAWHQTCAKSPSPSRISICHTHPS